MFLKHPYEKDSKDNACTTDYIISSLLVISPYYIIVYVICKKKCTYNENNTILADF